MAKNNGFKSGHVSNGKKVTSIGNSVRSKPKNKHKRKSHKKYRGQGR